MKLYFSEFDIPELQGLPVEHAREMWESCSRINGIGSIDWAIMTSILLIWTLFNFASEWVGVAAIVSVVMSKPFIIALMRPRLRRALETSGSQEGI